MLIRQKQVDKKHLFIDGTNVKGQNVMDNVTQCICTMSRVPTKSPL